MVTFNSCVLLLRIAFCCFGIYSLHNVKGSSAQPCPDLSWNHTFLDKAYYFLHEQHVYAQQVNTICKPLGTELLVIDSLAENDFIVEKLKAYEPGDSKVFLACPGTDTVQPRFFPCRSGSEATYNESSVTSKGFWNWWGGKPENHEGKCILLNTDDGAWTVAGCGISNGMPNFVICQCRRGIPRGTRVSTRFHQKAFETRNCLHADLIMRVVPVDNFIQCVMKCQSDGHCASFNLKNQDGITSPLICQLSLYHSSIVTTSFITDENCKYYERVR